MKRAERRGSTCSSGISHPRSTLAGRRACLRPVHRRRVPQGLQGCSVSNRSNATRPDRCLVRKTRRARSCASRPTTGIQKLGSRFPRTHAGPPVSGRSFLQADHTNTPGLFRTPLPGDDRRDVPDAHRTATGFRVESGARAPDRPDRERFEHRARRPRASGPFRRHGRPGRRPRRRAVAVRVPAGHRPAARRPGMRHRSVLRRAAGRGNGLASRAGSPANRPFATTGGDTRDATASRSCSAASTTGGASPDARTDGRYGNFMRTGWAGGVAIGDRSARDIAL